MIETFIAEDEIGSVCGILIDLPNGDQIWTGDVSDWLFSGQSSEVREAFPQNIGPFIVLASQGVAEIVGKAPDIDRSIEIARALAASR